MSEKIASVLSIIPWVLLLGVLWGFDKLEMEGEQYLLIMAGIVIFVVIAVFVLLGLKIARNDKGKISFNLSKEGVYESILPILPWVLLLALLWWFSELDLEEFKYPINLVLTLSIISTMFILLGLNISYEKNIGVSLSFAKENIFEAFILMFLVAVLTKVSQGYSEINAIEEDSFFGIGVMMLILNVSVLSKNYLVMIINADIMPYKIKKAPAILVVFSYIFMVSAFTIEMTTFSWMPDFVDGHAHTISQIIKKDSFDYVFENL